MKRTTREHRGNKEVGGVVSKGGKSGGLVKLKRGVFWVGVGLGLGVVCGAGVGSTE